MRALDAMLDGQKRSFLRGKVVCMVRVQREHDVARERTHFAHDVLHDGLRFGRAEGSVDEVVLHVHDDKIACSHACLAFA